jgi:uncharacterized protein YceK
MTRVVLLLIVITLLSGCAEETIFHKNDHEPVAGEATPAPQTGPRGGWAW